ncbi:MAG: molecular chaperone [Coriobacteriales bacterium]
MTDEQLGREQIPQLMDMREGIYRLFASLYFKELTLEQTKLLAGQDWDSFAELDPLMAQGAHNIKRSLRRVNGGTREDLAVDYAHTFLAAGSSKNESRACPYESVFTSRDGLIMQEARDEVYRYMLGEHLAPDESLHIPEDHIAFVFEFMANLCQRYVEAEAAGECAEAGRVFEVQRRFFTEHIINWIDMLCDAIERCCRTDFYRGVAQMTRGFLRLDEQMLEDMAAALAAGA